MQKHRALKSYSLGKLFVLRIKDDGLPAGVCVVILKKIHFEFDSQVIADCEVQLFDGCLFLDNELFEVICDAGGNHFQVYSTVE